MLKRLTQMIFLAGVLVLGVCGGAAQAETAGPVWRILAVSNPTNFKPGDQSGADAIVVTAVNVGGASAGCTQAQVALEEQEEKGGRKQPGKAGCTPGTPLRGAVTIADALPAGLKAVEVFGVNAYHNPFGVLGSGGVTEWSGPPGGLSCTLSSTTPSCTTSERIDPGDALIVTIRVHVETAREGPGEVNLASVSGGGGAGVSVSDPVVISTASPEYGVAQGGLLTATSSSQAGGHPNLTNEFFLNTVNPHGEAKGEHCGVVSVAYCVLVSEPVGSSKDIRFDLPRGLVGTTVGVARCTMAEVQNQANCPRDTMVGTATVIALAVGERLVITVPVYNIAPAPGEPLALAFDALFFPVRIDTSVLSDGEYNARVTVPGITGGASPYMGSVTIWGDPAEHNGFGPDAAAKNISGDKFLENGTPAQVSFGSSGAEEFYETGLPPVRTVYETRVPLLTNPTQCSSPLTAELETDSWEAPGDFAGVRTSVTGVGTDTGCGLLSFKPGLSMLPDTLEAGEPAGYSMQLLVPQNTEPEGLATPDVKKTVVTLPLGTVVSPSAADGLGDCSNEQFFGPGPREAAAAKPGECPRDSQIGTVRVKTPALEEPLTGAVYLAAPLCDPCTPGDASGGKMIRLFLQFVSEGEGGIVVKLEGTGQINQQTGQLTFTFNETPQLPFSEFKLTLTGGERAALANPRSCGTVSTVADLTPWSTPYTLDATPTSSFDVNENCFGAQFNPSFTAGTTNNQAGEASPFTLSFGRTDSDEFLNGLQLKLPPGLLGVLSRVSLCGEPQAAEGTCGAESLIGHVSVETGPGADPYVVNGGQVFVTGPYKGAPYGLSIVVPAKAGPYTLSGTTGKGTVVVRAAISVNPESSALTITADPLPTILDGIPLQLRQVNVTIDRPGFTFNPTDCDKLAITATLTSTQAASINASSPFQVTNCGSLKFQPKFTVSTSGKTSRVDGASLDARLTYPQNYGEANIAQVKVELPKQLPSRLPTLQKACTAAVFEANPADCPAASVVGVVKASTPILRSSLSGPVYFVSHGGEAFPSLIMVLQAEGVRVDLVGTTFISKAGVTSTTLKTVPDVPVSSFELYLPEGPTSALTTDGVLCTSSPVMPSTFTAQDGTELHESVKVAVTGCAKAKTKARKAKAKTSRAKASKAKASGAQASRARKASGARDARRARKASHDRGRKS